MFYLRPHLKDLSVTLIKARSECLAVFSVNPKALCPRQPRFIGKKSGYICSRNLSADPTSWCQLIICPLNLIRFSCAKTAGMENRALRTSTRSFAMTVRIDKAHARRHKRTRACTSTSRCRLCPPVSVQNQTLHPSAGVIPSDHGHIAIQWRFSHTNVSITAQQLILFHSIRCPYFAFPPPSSFNFATLQVDDVYLFTPFPPLLHWHGRNVPRTLSEVFQVWPACSRLLKKKKEKKEAKKQKKWV